MDNIHRDHNGYGGLHYTDTTGRNDITETHVSVTKKNIVFEVITADALTPCTDKNWMFLFIDTDSPSSGWEGFDYLIRNGQIHRFDTTTLKWHATVPITQNIDGNHLTISIPRKALHLRGKAFNLDFKWADNPTDFTDIISISTTGDTAPNRRFRYHFQWSK